VNALGNHRVFYLVLGLVVVLITSVQIGAYYYLQRFYGPVGSTPGVVDTLFNYGNGTMKWYNETRIPANWNFYNLTVYLTGGNIETKFYAGFNEHYMISISGIVEHSPYFCTLWIFCQKQSAWATSPVGADEIRLQSGGTLAWAFQIPYKSPVPGEGKVDSCS